MMLCHDVCSLQFSFSMLSFLVFSKVVNCGIKSYREF
jgi:hypothetical protein